jgi:hypothetical protein
MGDRRRDTSEPRWRGPQTDQQSSTAAEVDVREQEREHGGIVRERSSRRRERVAGDPRAHDVSAHLVDDGAGIDDPVAIRPGLRVSCGCRAAAAEHAGENRGADRKRGSSGALHSGMVTPSGRAVKLAAGLVQRPAHRVACATPQGALRHTRAVQPHLVRRGDRFGQPGVKSACTSSPRPCDIPCPRLSRNSRHPFWAPEHQAGVRWGPGSADDPVMPVETVRTRSHPPPAATFGATASAELDLRCEREQRATVHALRWAIDARGGIRSNVCTCLTCPSGENTRPWPTKTELQDAGAPSSVPHAGADRQSDASPSLSLSERLEASPGFHPST